MGIDKPRHQQLVLGIYYAVVGEFFQKILRPAHSRDGISINGYSTVQIDLPCFIHCQYNGIFE